MRIDAAARLAWFDDQPVELTAMEFDLLRVLAEHAGMALSREQLLEKVWGTNYYGESRWSMSTSVTCGANRRRSGLVLPRGGTQFTWVELSEAVVLQLAPAGTVFSGLLQAAKRRAL